jgi:hypothetical protein
VPRGAAPKRAPIRPTRRASSGLNGPQRKRGTGASDPARLYFGARLQLPIAFSTWKPLASIPLLLLNKEYKKSQIINHALSLILIFMFSF